MARSLVLGLGRTSASSSVLNKTAVAFGVTALVGCGAPATNGAPPAAAASPTASLTAAPTAEATLTAPATPAAKSPKQAQFEAENLDRLRALQVFTAADLIAGQPDETFGCYGPCSRLGKFVEAASNAALGAAPAGSCEKGAIDANIAAIEALKIVHVGGLLIEKPKTQPQCYNQPCANDVAAAQAVTCSRAGKLANIAAATKRL